MERKEEKKGGRREGGGRKKERERKGGRKGKERKRGRSKQEKGKAGSPGPFIPPPSRACTHASAQKSSAWPQSCMLPSPYIPCSGYRGQ